MEDPVQKLLHFIIFKLQSFISKRENFYSFCDLFKIPISQDPTVGKPDGVEPEIIRSMRKGVIFEIKEHAKYLGIEKKAQEILRPYQAELKKKGLI